MSFGDITRVNTNLQALNARFSLNKINQKIGENQLKLATGKRINRAEDDAAGFSIASKLTAQIGGLNQASRNIGDAKSMLDVAEGGMNSINDILTDIKAKAIQGATDSVGDTERGYIKTQIDNLEKQIDNVVSQTTFQGNMLLDGSTNTSGGALNFQVGAGTTGSDTQTVKIAGLNASGSVGGTGTAAGLGLASVGTTGGVATAGNFQDIIGQVDKAINALAAQFNSVGISQKSLSIKQDSIQQQITASSGARSRIQDADFAKLQSESIKLQIEQQTSTTAFAQANASSQSVLRFLGS